MFVFAIDFGAIALIRLAEREANLLESSRTYLLGDSLALPLYAAMAAIIVQSWEPSNPDRFFLRWRWHAALVGFGIALALLVDGAALIGGTESVVLQPTPSKVYHTVVFVPMFYLVASAFPAMLDARKPRPALAAGLGGLALYLCLAAADLSAGATALLARVV